MSISLYSAVIPTYQQILGSVAGLLDKAENHCKEKGIAAEKLIQTCLAEDMLPFAYQVKSCAMHSKGAIEGVRKGVFSPDMAPPPDSFAGLREKIAEARSALDALSEAEVDDFVGKPMRFEMDNFKLDFGVAENFLFSFSQPNFFFHATTTYDILRWQGLSIGKLDYMGKMRVLS